MKSFSELARSSEEGRKLRKYVFATQLIAIVMMAGIAIFSYTRSEEQRYSRRRLAGSASCDREVGVGELIWSFLITLYSFLGLAIVCDEYFQISLEIISETLKLSPDVAGATFLAAGSSAPELFTSLSDSFGDQNSVGMGTIVGSAMFNILVIVAASAAVAGKGGAHLDIDPRPVIRDVTYYTSSILLLSIFFRDAEIKLYEGIIMVLGYVSYIVFMKFNQRVFDKCDALVKGKNYADDKIHPENKDIEKTEEIIAARKQLAELELGPSKTDDDAQEEEEETRDAGFIDALKEKLEYPADGGGIDKFLYVLSVPWLIIFHFTIFDAGNKRYEKYYVGTFFLSILWIAFMCALMVNMATRAACFFDVSPIVLGVTVLAVGTSVPDAIGSILAAKSGEADMAIANAVGSNVFDILLGLGLPWTLVILVEGENVPVDKDGITDAVIILFVTVFLFLGVLIFRKWRMDVTVGYMLLTLYVAYIIYTLVNAGTA